MTNSAQNFAQVSLELGGKSAFIVFDDADLDSAVNGAISAIFGAAGQSCVAGSRLLVQESIAEKFLTRMTEVAGRIKIGDPMAEDTEMGPICTQGQLDGMAREVAFALAEGGTLLCGGKRADAGSDMFYEPTIIDCPGPHLRIVDTELFGPVLSVLRFRTEAEAMV